MRDDLPEIVAMGRNAGFGFIQVNTNGIRLAKDETFFETTIRRRIGFHFSPGSWFNQTTRSAHCCQPGRDAVEERRRLKREPGGAYPKPPGNGPAFPAPIFGQPPKVIPPLQRICHFTVSTSGLFRTGR